MKITALVPTLYTRDVPGTVEFYTTVLGFESDDPEDDVTMAFVRHDDITIMVALPNPHLPFEQPTLTGTLYFHCDDVEELWEAAREKARICYPLESFDYGMREFAIWDNNGYVLQFGQEVD
jgi:uncharacterized glyoxalase superfamily protein PhnB